MRPTPTLAAVLLATAAMTVAVAAGSTAVRAAPADPGPAADPSVFKPGPDVEVATAHCTVCHSAEYINDKPQPVSADFWQNEVAKMIESYGAEIPPDDAKKIVAYLNATYRAPG
jgi:cytochrome c5